jgi:predicted DNA-binding transcriptional regulator AlpA
MEPLLNLDQAGQLLGLNRKQVYELCRTRARVRQEHPIPVVRVGKYLRFRASSLNEWITKIERRAA